MVEAWNSVAAEAQALCEQWKGLLGPQLGEGLAPEHSRPVAELATHLARLSGYSISEALGTGLKVGQSLCLGTAPVRLLSSTYVLILSLCSEVTESF